VSLALLAAQDASVKKEGGDPPEPGIPVRGEIVTKKCSGCHQSDNQVGDACASCHPLARARSWFRSKEEWDLLVAMHEGYFPVVKRTSFLRPSYPPRGAGSGGGGRPDGESKEKQVDKAITYLSKTNPLLTPEWASWQSARRDPKLGGRWAVNAYLPGKGRFVGTMIVSENSEGVFETCGSLLTASTSLSTARVTQSSCSTLNRSSSSR
jgi:hypothetical protein